MGEGLTSFSHFVQQLFHSVVYTTIRFVPNSASAHHQTRALMQDQAIKMPAASTKHRNWIEINEKK